MAKILKQFRSNGLWLIVGLFYGYLAFHALSGSQGVIRLAQIDGEIDHLKERIVKVKAERVLLERHAMQLRSSSLSPDTLDEEARRLLSVSHAKEVVILLDDTP